MPVTIFEGPDGAGKTTLTEAWMRQIHRKERYVPHQTNHGPYPGLTEIAGKYLDDLLLAYGPRNWHVLMDRAWLSEPVYGPVMRDENRIDVARRRCLERVALACQTVVVLCLPPFETCKKNYLTRKALEYLPTEHHLQLVHEGFTQLWQMAHRAAVPMICYDYTSTDLGRSSFVDLTESVRPAENFGPGVGAWKPGQVTLLVGEAVNRNTAAALLPFVSWDPGGCIGWLSRQLEDWGVGEDELYWINAVDAKGHDVDPRPWLDQLNPKRIVAMGETATTWCLEHKLRHDSIAHPQHWKRFKHNQPYPLKRILRP